MLADPRPCHAQIFFVQREFSVPDFIPCEPYSIRAHGGITGEIKKSATIAMIYLGGEGPIFAHDDTTGEPDIVLGAFIFFASFDQRTLSVWRPRRCSRSATRSAGRINADKGPRIRTWGGG